MSESDAPELLRRHRPLLLALEAIGWLHMGGKAKIDFLKKQGGKDIVYKENNWLTQEATVLPWNDLLSWLPTAFPLSHSAWPKEGDLTSFSSKHMDSDVGLLGLLQAAHGMASGIEKNIPSATSAYLGQHFHDMWLSSAFGNPICNLGTTPPAVLADDGWKRLLKNVKNLLVDLERLGAARPPHTPDDLSGWWEWREKAVGEDGWLRRAFSCTLAETRLPNNDVTLFDQSYVAAALFKSAVAGALLEGKKFPWDKGLKQKTRWRLLTVGLGMDRYEARAVKIGDWIGAAKARDDFFRQVRQLVEVDLAVGALLYRDDSVCVFTFPGERRDRDPKACKDGDLHIADWEKFLRQELDGHAAQAGFELPPYCAISEEPSRSLVHMTREIRTACETMFVPLFRAWTVPAQGSGNGHVCPVCRVRRNDAAQDKQQPCPVCRKRRSNRREAWLQGTNDDTIWIDEVADANDRVALLTLRLDIEHWLDGTRLDGTRLDSLRTQSIREWRKANEELTEYWQRDESKRRKEANPITLECPLKSLRQEIKNRFGGKFSKNDLLLCNLQTGYRHAQDWGNFFSDIVEDRANAPKWEELHNADDRAAWLAHQLFRKLPSPGRIYRFQRQAKEFFGGLLPRFRNIAARDESPWRTQRLLLKPKAVSENWQDRQPYNGRCNGVPINLLYLRDRGGFLTIWNLARILGTKHDETWLQGKKISLKNDKNEGVDPLEVQSVEKISEDWSCRSYRPVIPLELSPQRFRVLVPLVAASSCMDLAFIEWKKQFARVWDRLPLHAGIVAFPRKTPFQAVVEAIRNMEDDKGKGKRETWRIKRADSKEKVVRLCLAPAKNTPQARMPMPQVRMIMPKCLPDGTDDVFYPYLAVKENEAKFPLDFQAPSDGQVYRHVTDLKEDNKISVHPGRVATLFLDGTAGRFEPLPVRNLLLWPQMRMLWRFLKRTAPSQTALRGAWSELCARRAWQCGGWVQDGREAWLNLARTIFRIRLNVKGTALDKLTQAAGNGLLEWCLTWHIGILKERIVGGDR